MPYADGRVIHDADAHIMEMPGFLTEHLEAKYRVQVTDAQLFPRRDGFQSRLADADTSASSPPRYSQSGRLARSQSFSSSEPRG